MWKGRLNAEMWDYYPRILVLANVWLAADSPVHSTVRIIAWCFLSRMPAVCSPSAASPPEFASAEFRCS